jgi:predicted small secreted protein
MSNRTVAVSAFLAAVLALTGCANTIRGAGRDASNTVNATGAAARDVVN